MEVIFDAVGSFIAQGWVIGQALPMLVALVARWWRYP